MELTGFVSEIFDRALGVFDRVADLEISSRELDVTRDIQIFKAAQAADDQARQDAVLAPPGMIAGMDNNMLLLLGGLAIAAVIVLR